MNATHTKLLIGIVAATSAATSLSCSGSDYGTGTNNGPNGASVNASAAAIFAPNIVQVTQGQPVTWVFGAVEHTVTFAVVAGAPSNIPASMNTEVSRTFSTVGDYAYTCSIHAGMSGTIKVTGSPVGGY